MQPHRQQPTRLHHPWDSPGKNAGMGCHFLLQWMKVKVKSLSRVRLFTTPWTVAHQALPSMGFSRQESWSGVLLPSPNSSLSLIIKSNRDGVKAAELCCPSSFLKTVNHTLRLCSPFLNQPWIFIGRTDAEAETAILWPPDAKSQLLEKTLMLGKIEGKRRSG